MEPKLPPLSWFRAFEAAARHLNVTAAAQELGLTQPAVSQHIRLLEHRFNMQLFERQARGLALTDAGRRLLPQVSESIDGLTRLMSEFDTAPEQRRLNVAASASFARSFIAPVLPNFLKTHEAASVRIRTTLWHDDFSKSEADVEFRFGSAGLAGRQAVELFPDQIVAVCSPHYFSANPDWSDICDACRIQTVGTSETWERWSMALEMPTPDGNVQLVDSHSLAIDLACNGTGVVLTSLLQAAPSLLSGDLQLAVSASVDASERYYLVLKEPPSNSLAIPFAEMVREGVRYTMDQIAEMELKAH